MLGLALSLTVHLGATGALFWQWSAAPPEPVRPAEPPTVLVTLPPLPKASPQPGPPGPVARTVRHHTAPQPAPVVETPPHPALLAVPPPEPTRLTLDRIETSPDMAPPPSIEEGRETFEGLLLARIEQVRRYPDDALRQRREGTVQVRFRMDRKGQVLAADVEKSSGVKLLDREALATIFRAQPLPRIPSDRPDILAVLVPVEFKLTDQRNSVWVKSQTRIRTGAR